MKLFDSFRKEKKEEKDFPPKPKWKPNLPIDLDLIFDSAKYYTEKKVQLAVFKNGTVVIFPNKIENINEEAVKTLNKIYNAHPDFKLLTTDDGNFLIEYSQPAFNIVFKYEIEKYWDYIDKNHQDGICRDEVLINSKGQHNVFDKLGKICLFGRTKMFMDAQEPEVILKFEPEK